MLNRKRRVHVLWKDTFILKKLRYVYFNTDWVAKWSANFHNLGGPVSYESCLVSHVVLHYFTTPEFETLSKSISSSIAIKPDSLFQNDTDWLTCWALKKYSLLSFYCIIKAIVTNFMFLSFTRGSVNVHKIKVVTKSVIFNLKLRADQRRSVRHRLLMATILKLNV